MLMLYCMRTTLICELGVSPRTLSPERGQWRPRPIATTMPTKISKRKTNAWEKLSEDDHPHADPTKGDKAATRATINNKVARNAANTSTMLGMFKAGPNPERTGTDQTTMGATTATVEKVRTERQDQVPSTSRMALRSISISAPNTRQGKGIGISTTGRRSSGKEWESNLQYSAWDLKYVSSQVFFRQC